MYTSLLMIVHVGIIFYGSFAKCAMEPQLYNSPYSLTTYCNDTKKSLIPWPLVRKSNVLYEQYCQKLSTNERLFLNAPANSKQLNLFVNSFVRAPGITLENYCKQWKYKKLTKLINVAGMLQSPWALAQLLDVYMLSDVKTCVTCVLMKSIAELIRYKTIINNAPETNISFPCALVIADDDDWHTIYKGDGTYVHVPSCVDAAQWDEQGYDHNNERYQYMEIIVADEKQYEESYLVDYIHDAGDVIHYIGQSMSHVCNGDSTTPRKHSWITRNKHGNNVTKKIDFSGQISQLVFSRNGTWLVGALQGAEKKIFCCDMQNCGNVRSFALPATVVNLCFNHASTLSVVATDGTKNNVIICSLKDPFFEHAYTVAGIETVQFSPDDQKLILVAYDNSTNRSTIYSMYNGRYRDKKIKVKGLVLKIIFNPKSNNAVALIDGGYFVLFDLMDLNNAIECAYKNFDKDSNSPDACPSIATFSSDGRFFVTLSATDWSLGFSCVSPLQLWNGTTGDFIGFLSDPNERIYGVGFTPDLRYVMAATEKKFDERGIICTELYTEDDAQEIEQIATHKPRSLLEALQLWRACKETQEGQMYCHGEKQLSAASEEIRKIIFKHMRK